MIEDGVKIPLDLKGSEKVEIKEGFNPEAKPRQPWLHLDELFKEQRTQAIDPRQQLLSGQRWRLLQDISYLLSQSPAPSISFSNVICIGGDRFTMSQNLSSNYIYFSEDSTFACFQHDQGQNVLTHPSPIPGKPINLNGFAIFSSEITEGPDRGKIRVQLYDCLSEGTPLLSEMIVSYDDRGKEEVGKKFKEIIDREYKLRLPKWQEQISRLEPMANPESYAPLAIIPHNHPIQTGLPQNVTILASVDGAGRESNHGNTNIKIDPSELSTHDYHVNGVLRSASITFTTTITSIERDESDLVISVNGKPVNSKYKDEHGNIIAQRFHILSGLKPGDTISNIVDVYVPYNCSATSQNLKVNLEPIGLGAVTLPIYQRPIPVIAQETQNSAPIHSFMTLADFGPQGPQLFNSITTGVNQAIATLGGNPITDLSQVVIVNAFETNAFVNELNPSSITILDEVLNHPPHVIANVSQHEAFHLIDYKYGGRLSGAKFTEFYQQILSREDCGRSFFSLLNEKSFCQAIGGHSADNAKELFASLLNAVMHPNFEERIKSMPEAFRKDLKEAILALVETLNSVGEFPKDAPIFSILNDRLNTLDSINTGGKQVDVFSILGREGS